jgi:hypothetical protein
VIRSCLVFLLLLASGCAPFRDAYRLVDSSVLSNEYQGQPLAAEDVNVFLASDVIPTECRRVALLRAVPTVTVVNLLRTEAGRLGANAVDLRDYRTTGAIRPEQADEGWDAVALYCPTGNVSGGEDREGWPTHLP